MFAYISSCVHKHWLLKCSRPILLYLVYIAMILESRVYLDRAKSCDVQSTCRRSGFLLVAM